MTVESHAAATRLAPVKRMTLRKQVVESLRSAILQGDFPPGSPITEATLANSFRVSRGPLREALQVLTEEGLLITEPYVGTRVAGLSKREIHEIYSLRTELEVFAFRQVWPKRTQAFFELLNRRHDELLAALETAGGGDAILAEMALHSVVYEWVDHQLLLNCWRNLRGKLQLYWSAHHRAHGRRGAHPDGHRAYVSRACGDSLDLMLEEIRAHMVRGLDTTLAYLEIPQPNELWARQASNAFR